jgi:protein translocase SEC61 complex gamma subunit
MVYSINHAHLVKDINVALLDRCVVMRLTGFFRSAARLLRTISKPDRKTFWLSVKICFFGVAILGAIGYLIRLVSVTIQGI